jgi:alkylation response protein AidB-like acyl-CoA dehydrogenase
MASTSATSLSERRPTDWVALADRLGPGFAKRAASHDSDDSFVADNYAELRAHKVFSAHVPAELGGGGADYAEICAMLRTLAHYCGSTALALSMHSHQVATPTWRWRHEKAPLEPLLRRIAAEQLVLLTSGGSDWLPGSGKAEKVDGGYRITARKTFSSGSPAGDLLMTMAVYDDPEAGPTVLHFGVPVKHESVKIHETWRAMGMRGTGSNDVQIDGFVVPDAAVGARRPAGKWHHLFHIIYMNAFPLIYSVYVGLAEAARVRALEAAQGKREDQNLQLLVGEMETELVAAQLALQHMIDTVARGKPGAETTNAMAIGRTLAGRHAIRTVEKAMEVAGGRAFYRDFGLERLFRDVQGARFHPLQEKPQQRYSGRLALGLDISEAI